MQVPPRTDFRDPLEICLKLTKVGYTAEDAEDREGRRVGVIRSIPVNAVLAVAWNQMSLESCRCKLALGHRPPRIQVIGIRRKGHPTLYTVSDGMHRTVAAREAGRPTIRAEIHGWLESDPSKFFLHRGHLYNATNPLNCLAVASRMTPATVAELVELGVLMIPDNASVSAILADNPQFQR